MKAYLSTDVNPGFDVIPDPVICDNTVPGINVIFNQVKDTFGYTLFLGDGTSFPGMDLIRMIILQRGDCWHAADRRMELPEFYYFKFIRPCWMLNAKAAAGISYIDWKISATCFLIRNDIILSIGFLQPGFETIQSALADWGLRAIQKGVIPVYQPSLLPFIEETGQEKIAVPLWDQLLFLKQHGNSMWQYWALYRIARKEKIPFLHLIKGRKKQQEIKTSPKASFYQHQDFILPGAPAPKISVILITLGRYQYIDTVVDLLQKQSLLPYEIIIVDGTPEETQQAELLKKYAGSTVPIVVEKALVMGQCSQRNQAINRSTGDYVFFIDDDMEEVMPDHLAKHWGNLQRYQAQVSSGMPDEVGIAPIDRKNKMIKVSDVFPTNDSLVHKPALLRSGLFDIKMDRGQSEDHELGLRLFRSGALMVQDPAIRSLHLRAPSGGLRTHGARKITYSGARNSLTQRRIPHLTEFYLRLKHHPETEVEETKLISAVGTFSIRGNMLKKILKVVISLAYLPQTLKQLNRKMNEAKILLIK